MLLNIQFQCFKFFMCIIYNCCIVCVQLLLSFLYKNNDHTEPVEGTRTVTAVVQDGERTESQKVFIYINVTRKNDKPDVDLGVGKNRPDNTTFKEVEKGELSVGIHIATLPHRVEISDETEELHYTTKVIVNLRASSCGQLDEGEEFIYFLGIMPSELTVSQVPSGFQITFEPKIEPPTTVEGITALNDMYEEALFDTRYLHAGDEPTVLCPGEPEKLLYRYIDVTVIDSGHPPQNRTVTTRVEIIPVNDQAPKLIVQASGDCLLPENELSSVHLFDDIEPGPASAGRRKRDFAMVRQGMAVEPPRVASVGVFGGWEKEFSAGSQIVMKFSVDTNTPFVLRPNDLQQVVNMSPPWLHDLPHIGVWKDLKTLHIVFPVVNGSMNGKVTADELVVSFPNQTGCIDLGSPSCPSICDSTGQSCGILGSYGISGGIDLVTLKPKEPDKSVMIHKDEPEKSVIDDNKPEKSALMDNSKPEKSVMMDEDNPEKSVDIDENKPEKSVLMDSSKPEKPMMMDENKPEKSVGVDDNKPEKSVMKDDLDRPEESVGMEVDDLQQAQLHGWLLATLGVAIMVIVLFAIGCKKYKATTSKPKPLIG
jgi:hypothetical protein